MKQHHTPCPDCPFRKDCPPGELGGSSPFTYISQANGPFWLPCHAATNYLDPNWRQSYERTPQCVGAAIYRANNNVVFGNDFMLREPSNTTVVFATPAEFLAHHLPCDKVAAEVVLQEFPPAFWTAVELTKPSKHRKTIDTGTITERPE